ncbi:cyclin domain-containing protein [Theileria equi strain WA]|uniref:Cyclin domain-containing protein n=1 Tax=Theileria equi strain WA TaxID=1537102 RepID=L0B0X8_THEEQ|nr:cyclin domain-containing protein [Theileria equi strain WA]AFZ81173.1 cyclin domain-containing protein [Theileria equi strain WA]|eukprot:XP_004830839.1 cyclin domain-containing protein [Theileria equi strain WA]
MRWNLSNGPETVGARGNMDECIASAAGEGFIKTLGAYLTKIVEESAPTIKCIISTFNSVNAPPVSDYLARIARYVHCSNECFVLALVYIDRIVKYHKDFTVSVVNIHRLLITAIMLAAKFSDDVYYSNSFYAQVGGIKVSEINVLEAQFLMLINYQLYVNATDYENCRRGVEISSARPYLSIAHPFSPIPTGPFQSQAHASVYSQDSLRSCSIRPGNTGARVVSHARPPVHKDRVVRKGVAFGASSVRNGDYAGSMRNVEPMRYNGYLHNGTDYNNYFPYPHAVNGYDSLNTFYYRSDSSMTSSTVASSGDYFDYSFGYDCHSNLCRSIRSKFDECEAFVNALESRYRDNLKRKCSPSVGNWNLQQQHLNLVQCSKVKRNTW